MAFETILGNQKNKETLNKIIEANRIVNGYMFVGKEGIGKMLFAKEFAKMILCQGETKKPCNNCKSCIEFSGDNNPDIKIIEPDGNSIKIEQIRIMNSKVIEKPITSNKKVYIINNSEKMTIEAQNCLLKTLEEPPEYASIILICNNEAQMLTTIKSRCTKIVFNELKNSEINEYLEKQTNGKVGENILKLAEGSIGRAIQIKDKEDLYLQIQKIIENIETTKKSEIWKISEIIYKSVDDITEILDYMNIMFLDNAKKDLKYVNCIQIVENAKKRLKTNSNYNMTIDNLLLQIWEEINEKYNRGKV